MPAQSKKGKKKPWGAQVEKGYKFSNATRKKMAAAKKGRKLSQETKDKISAARKEREWLVAQGYREPFTHSAETKRKLSRLMKKRRHRPTRKAVRASANNRSDLAQAKRIARRYARGKV